MSDNILTRIIANKRCEVEAMMAVRPIEASALAEAVQRRRMSCRSFSRTLAASPTGIIAEFKRRSPSKGDIHPLALVSDVIPSYARAGASACSVLTDTPYFGGALTDLALARTLTDIPLLRKDFTVSDYQIQEAALCGADAILLIASALTRDEIERFTATAHSLSLEVLLELHSLDELDRFCPEVDMVGVNNRNLSTFHTDPTLSLTLARQLPDATIKVAESGLTSMAEVTRLRDVGYRGFLIGETFMRHPSPGDALAKFLKEF